MDKNVRVKVIIYACIYLFFITIMVAINSGINNQYRKLETLQPAKQKQEDRAQKQVTKSE